MDPIDRRVALAGLGVVGAAALAKRAKAGPIDPPAGPVSSTGMTTDQLSRMIARPPHGVAEPRIPIESLPSSADSLFVISQPGSYYFTRNCTCPAGFHAVSVQADDVCIDMQGFSIIGTPGQPGSPGSLSAIRCSPGTTGLSVCDGSIVGCDKGVDACDASSTCVDSLTVRECSTGLCLSKGSYVCDCVCSHLRTAIDADQSMVIDCTFESCGEADTTGVGGLPAVLARTACCVCDCSFTNCPEGVHAQTGGSVECCSFHKCATGCIADNRVEVCECVVNECAVGVSCGTDCCVTECKFTNCPVGLQGQTGGSMESCSFKACTTGAIWDSRSEIWYCVFQGCPTALTCNAGCVISENTFISCSSSSLTVTGTGCLVTCNCMHLCPAPVIPVPGNTFGPIVDVAGIGDLSSSLDQRASNPYANHMH